MPVRIVCAFLIVLGSLGLSAQQKSDEGITPFMPTEAINTGKKLKPNKYRPERRNVEYIYTNDSKGIYFGNPCVMEATRSMGFEYVLQVKGIPGSPSEDEQFEHNVIVKTKLVFTRSPFWKLILKKKIKKCLEMSGDFVG